MSQSRQTEWWREGVIYQIYPRSYAAAGRQGVGDLVGVESKLDYIAALGVDILWLSPFFTSPMKDYGYDIADFCNVDPLFGTLEDFDSLLAAVHSKGLKLIIDQAYNHSSDEHPWFQESRQDRTNPKADWYIWVDPNPDGTPPNNWLSVFGGCGWEWEPRRSQYYFHQFLKEQPDLNFNNPAVQEAILDVARFWLERGVDGFRLDTVVHYLQDPQLRNNPPASVDYVKEFAINPYYRQEHRYDVDFKRGVSFIEKLRSVTDEYKERMTMGEIGGTFQLEALALYTQTNKRLHTSYTFNFLFEFTAGEFRAVFNELNQRLGDGWATWAFSNHDVVRIASRNQVLPELQPQFRRMMFALLLSMRGTPCIYQGEELGLTEAELAYEELQDPFGRTFWPNFKGRDGCRTPMPWQKDVPNAGFSVSQPWLPIPAAHLPLAVDAQERDESSMLHFSHQMLQWRKQYPAMRVGDMKLIDSPSQVLAFTRTKDDEKLFFAFNYAADSVQFTSPFEGLQFKLHPSIDAKLKGDRIDMSPYNVCILEVS